MHELVEGDIILWDQKTLSVVKDFHNLALILETPYINPLAIAVVENIASIYHNLDLWEMCAYIPLYSHPKKCNGVELIVKNVRVFVHNAVKIVKQEDLILYTHLPYKSKRFFELLTHYDLHKKKQRRN